MVTPNSKIMFGTALIGFGVQGSIGGTTSYRLRHGNGHYGSILNRLYQDKFVLVVPTSITHSNGDASRTCFASAVSSWQGLSAAEKADYNRLAAHIRHLAGYHLYLRRYMQDNY